MSRNQPLPLPSLFDGARAASWSYAPDAAKVAVEAATWRTAHGLKPAATDAGLVRVEPRNGALVETRQFPDTEPFVTRASGLLAGPKALYVIEATSIHTLRIRA